VFRKRCATNCYKKLYIRALWLEKGQILSFVIIIRNTGSHGRITDSLFQRMLRFNIPDACTLEGQGPNGSGQLCTPPPLCGVPSCVFKKSGCAASEIMLAAHCTTSSDQFRGFMLVACAPFRRASGTVHLLTLFVRILQLLWYCYCYVGTGLCLGGTVPLTGPLSIPQMIYDEYGAAMDNAGSRRPKDSEINLSVI
jgi:hypothetical protein